jgi:hypothetical protein
MDDELRQRILDEVAALQYQIHTCDHCESLRQQIVRLLSMLLPPPPVVISAQQALELQQWMKEHHK